MAYFNSHRGRDGRNGIAGEDGEDGVNGSSGSSGYSGGNGQSGTSGTSARTSGGHGTDGADATDGRGAKLVLGLEAGAAQLFVDGGQAILLRRHEQSCFDVSGGNGGAGGAGGRGGDGGVGGSGGAGGRGSTGSSSSHGRGGRGGDGGNGGRGGDGGDGTNGGAGGNGGNGGESGDVSLFSDAPCLLSLITLNASAGAYGAGGAGGRAGAGGRGGSGGRGGRGGRGGSGEKGRGFSGSSGYSGSSGRSGQSGHGGASGRAGTSGKAGKITYNVRYADGHEEESSHNYLLTLELKLKERGDVRDGVFSPGKTVTIEAHVQNVGGLTFPKGAILRVLAKDFFAQPMVFELPALPPQAIHLEAIDSKIRPYFAHGDTLKANAEIDVLDVFSQYCTTKHEWLVQRPVHIENIKVSTEVSPTQLGRLSFTLCNNSLLSYGTDVGRSTGVVIHLHGEGVQLKHGDPTSGVIGESKYQEISIIPKQIDSKSRQDEQMEIEVLPSFDFEYNKNIMLQIQFYLGGDQILDRRHVIRVARRNQVTARYLLLLGPMGGHLYYAGYRLLPVIMSFLLLVSVLGFVLKAWWYANLLSLLQSIGLSIEHFSMFLIGLLGILLCRTLYDWWRIENRHFTDRWGDLLISSEEKSLSASGLTLVDCRMRDFDHALVVFDSTTTIAEPFYTKVVNSMDEANSKLFIEVLQYALSSLTHICASADKAARLVEVLPLYAVSAYGPTKSKWNEQKTQCRLALENGQFERIELEDLFSKPASFGALSALLTHVEHHQPELKDVTCSFLLNFSRLVIEADRQIHESEIDVLTEVYQFLGVPPPKGHHLKERSMLNAVVDQKSVSSPS